MFVQVLMNVEILVKLVMNDDCKYRSLLFTFGDVSLTHCIVSLHYNRICGMQSPSLNKLGSTW